MILWANLSIENPVKLNIRSGKENLHKHEKQGEKRNRQDLGELKHQVTSNSKTKSTKSRQLTRILHLGHVWMHLFELLPLTIYFQLISINSQGFLIKIAYSFYKTV
jgi:hypothetical protein